MEQPIYRAWRPKGCPLTLYLAITYNGGSCQRQRQFLPMHTHCSICTHETEMIRSQEHEFTNTCSFQAHKLQSFMLRRDICTMFWLRLYLFIKQWKDRIYVNTLNDHFSMSCQMSIESVIQPLPVDSVLTDVIPCLFIETIIIAGFCVSWERKPRSFLTLLGLSSSFFIFGFLKLSASF